MTTEEIDWGELGKDWWIEAGAACGATNQQIIFALHRWKGMTATASAKAAKYAGDADSIRQAGHRAAHSTAVMGLLSMAKAETGQGPDGNVTMTEAKQILSRLARGSDPNVRIKAIESLAKIERDERELERERENGLTDIHAELREIEKIAPDLARAYAAEKGVSWKSGRLMTDRTPDEIIAGLSNADRVVADHVAKIEQMLERRNKTANWLMGILEPHIRKIVKEEIGND